MKDSFGLCVVGYGLAGKAFHAPLIAATNGLHLAGIVSSHPEKVSADYPGIAVYSTLDEALQVASVDAVVLACPDDLHVPFARQVLESGRHVVVDKPLAPTYDEACEVTALATEVGKLLTVFHNRRWDADFLTLRALIDSGELGEIMQFESHFDRFKPDVGRRWNDLRTGGAWFDLGAHLVDQALCLFGLPQAIYADIDVQKAGGIGIDYAHALLRYPRTRVILHISQSTPDHRLRFAVHGTKGSWIKHNLDVQEGQSKAGLKVGDEGWGEDPVPGRIVSANGASRVHPNKRGDYAVFYKRLRSAYAGESKNPIAPDEALAVMKILDAGLDSAGQRREIALDNDLEDKS